MNFIPNGSRLLVSELQATESKIGGIVVPASAPLSAHLKRSVVEAVGPDATAFKVGDVIAHPVAGYELTLDGKGYRVVPQDDVLGKITK